MRTNLVGKVCTEGMTACHSYAHRFNLVCTEDSTYWTDLANRLILAKFLQILTAQVGEPESRAISHGK